MAHAAITLARHSALKATKRQLAAQGLKVNHFSRRDLVAHAETYFADHRETLIAEAREVVAQWGAKGYFGRRSKLNTDASREGLNRKGFCRADITLKSRNENDNRICKGQH